VAALKNSYCYWVASFIFYRPLHLRSSQSNGGRAAKGMEKKTFPMTRAVYINVLCVFLVFFTLCDSINATAVISIDFGEDIRIGLIKVGQRSPMDLVLNEESNRKSASLLAITKDEVFVSTEAKNIVHQCCCWHLIFIGFRQVGIQRTRMAC
jgi:hypothetical protein